VGRLRWRRTSYPNLQLATRAWTSRVESVTSQSGFLYLFFSFAFHVGVVAESCKLEAGSRFKIRVLPVHYGVYLVAAGEGLICSGSTAC
jgi:hypothetical protein